MTNRIATLVALVLLALAALGAATTDAAAGVPRARGVRCRLASGRVATLAAVPHGDPTAPRRTDGALPPSGRVDDEDLGSAGKIFGDDDRRPVADPTAYPWSAAARVVSYFPNGFVGQGSAILVGPRHALTAGHVVFDRRNGGFAVDVEVVPGAHGDAAPFGRFLADQVTAFAGWVRDGDLDYDLALLRLDGAAGDAAGWLGLAAWDDAALLGATARTAGYPGDLGGGLTMHAAAGPVEGARPGQILFRGTLDAAGGQSGSGLWARCDDGRHVLGIVSSQTRSWNRAARVTPEVFDSLLAWMVAGPDFSVRTVTHSSTPEFEAPAAIPVTLMVVNDGDAAARAQVVVSARDGSGRRLPVAEGEVWIDAFDYAVTTLPASFDAALRAGTYALEAEIDGEGLVAELDRTNNRLSGPSVVVLPAFETVAAGRTGTAVLDPGGVARYRVDVPDGRGGLRIALRAPPRAVVTITAPGGKPTLVEHRAFACGISATAPGAWEIDVRMPPTARGRHRVRVRALER